LAKGKSVFDVVGGDEEAEEVIQGVFVVLDIIVREDVKTIVDELPKIAVC
jgi:hypothetical protein